jgi:hypothetical protein
MDGRVPVSMLQSAPACKMAVPGPGRRRPAGIAAKAEIYGQTSYYPSEIA